MKIQENFCYSVKREFKAGDNRYKSGDEIEIFSIDGERVSFAKKYCWDDPEPSHLSVSDLLNYLDVSTGYKHFGVCERCGCDLTELPGPFGVGYVCNPCARVLTLE